MAQDTHAGTTHDTSAVPRRPQTLSGGQWKSAFAYVKDSIGRDHLTIVAPGVAFYLLLGLIPALVVLVSLYGLVFDPSDVQTHFAALEGVLPPEAHQLLMSQMDRIVEEQGAAGIGAIVGIVLSLWAGSQAVQALMEGLNIAYETKEERGFVKRIAIRLGLTLAAVVLGILAIGMIAVVPPLLNALPLPEAVLWLLSLARWPLLLLVGILGIALLYRYAPDRRQPPMRWLSWGAGLAALLWVVASILFSVYVANFGNYNETYGALGAVVILLLWLLITAFVILLGAEVDAAMEGQMREQRPA